MGAWVGGPNLGIFSEAMCKDSGWDLTLGCAMYLHLRDLGLAWLLHCSPMKVLTSGLFFVSANSIVSF